MIWYLSVGCFPSFNPEFMLGNLGRPTADRIPLLKESFLIPDCCEVGFVVEGETDLTREEARDLLRARISIMGIRLSLTLLINFFYLYINLKKWNQELCR